MNTKKSSVALSRRSLFYFRDKIMLYIFYARTGKTIADDIEGPATINTSTGNIVYADQKP